MAPRLSIARSNPYARPYTGRDDVGQQGVAGRDAQAAGGPGAGAEHGDLPDGGGGADEAGQDGGGGVAADGLGAAAPGVVGDGAAGQPGHAGEAVGDAFDEAEGGGRSAEGGGEQAGQQGGGDLVADVGQEAGRADAGHPGPEQRCGDLVGSLMLGISPGEAASRQATGGL